MFTVGSAVCGLAVSMNTLIAARVLQGLGGGGIMVSIFAVNADLFEPRERARYQSYSSLVLMASSAIGPVLGGMMSDLFGWRSIFLVNVPIGFIVLTGLAFMLPYRKPHRRPKIDYAGAMLLALTTTSIVMTTDSSELFGSLDFADRASPSSPSASSAPSPGSLSSAAQPNRSFPCRSFAIRSSACCW